MMKKQEILNLLKHEILTLQLQPGTIISESTLTERFSLSRTPIRDILKHLSNEGYIDIYPQRGSVVSYIDLDSVEQVIYLRSILEKEIITELCGNLTIKGQHELLDILEQQKLCIQNKCLTEDFLKLDDAFHYQLFKVSGRTFLWEIIHQYQVHYSRYRKLHMLKLEKLNDILLEHQTILNCLIQDEKSAIKDLMHQHLKADVDSMYFQTHYSNYIKTD